MTINDLIKANLVKLPPRNPHRRIFYLTRAENRAQNPEFKELWKRKKEELLKNL
jgi:hypothetical protein